MGVEMGAEYHTGTGYRDRPGDRIGGGNGNEHGGGNGDGLGMALS